MITVFRVNYEINDLLSHICYAWVFSAFPSRKPAYLGKGGGGTNYGHFRFLLFPDFLQTTQGRWKHFMNLWPSFWETGAAISLYSAELCVNVEGMSIIFEDNARAFQNVSGGKTSLCGIFNRTQQPAIEFTLFLVTLSGNYICLHHSHFPLPCGYRVTNVR